MSNTTRFIALEKISDNKYKTKNNVVFNVVQSPDNLNVLSWENSPVVAMTSQPLNRCRIRNIDGLLCLVIDDKNYENCNYNRSLLSYHYSDDMIIQQDHLLNEALKPDLLNL
jgi:hypothetical protein